MNVEIKRMSTLEENISLRTIWYDIYVGGAFFLKCDDLFVALEVKEKILNGTFEN